MENRISIFIDGENAYYAQRSLGWFFDPAKMRNYWSHEGRIQDSFWYASIKKEQDPKEQKFFGYLNHSGFTVRTKLSKYFRSDDEGGEEVLRRGNVNIDMVIDILTTTDQYDTAILVTGNGDFEPLIELLRSQGKRVIIVATQDTVARELRNAVGGFFYDLSEMRAEIERKESL